MFRCVHRRVLGKALTIFVYHDVAADPGEFSCRHHLNVVPDVFARQMDLIREHFNVIGPDALTQGVLPERAAMITFDDGFKGFFSTALPVLRSRGMPVTIFLNMAALRGEVLWAALVTWLCARDDFRSFCQTRGIAGRREAPLFLFCSRELVEPFLVQNGKDRIMREARRFQGCFADENDLLREDGKGVYYANHLYDHEVPLLMSDQAFLEAYRRNAEALSGYKSYRDMFSFPFGQPGTCFDRHHVDLLKGLGLKHVFFSSGGVNFDQKDVLQDRFELHQGDDAAELMWGSIFEACRQGSRKRGAF